jgi:hypothetical protein
MGGNALKPITLTASTVVLASATWKEELTKELILLGLTPEAAATGALHSLQHIVSRYGWPAQTFQVVEIADEEQGEL